MYWTNWRLSTTIFRRTPIIISIQSEPYLLLIFDFQPTQISSEIILTLGMSKTVEQFLKAAAHVRNYSVIVAETAPSYNGREMAKSLSSASISTFLVPDSSIFALMSRVNKVILGAHAILANGGMFAISGSL